MAVKISKMSNDKAIEVAYPAFLVWIKNIKGYQNTPDGIHMIKLWYEFLGSFYAKPKEKTK